MRVNQTIRIGSLSVNSMSNSAILQVGTSGAIRSRSEQITEQVTPAQAEQQLEQKIQQEIEPLLHQEGLPVETPPQQGAATGTAPAPSSGATSAEVSSGIDIQERANSRKNRT